MQACQSRKVKNDLHANFDLPQTMMPCVSDLVVLECEWPSSVSCHYHQLASAASELSRSNACCMCSCFASGSPQHDSPTMQLV
jgi:hypothetical protein